MRILVDLTNSPHVPLFAPLGRRLESRGHEVLWTARRFAQTVELAQLHGIPAVVIGAHGGSSRLGKARAATGRTAALLLHVRRLQRDGGRIDVAISHGSTDLPLVSRALGIPHVTMFDYEWATTMHRLNVRASWRVVTPDAIPPGRLDAYGAAAKLAQYPGLKEDYYLADTPLDPVIRHTLGVAENAVLAVLRPPPELALYHRGRHNHLFGQVLERVQRTAGVVAVVLARTVEQRLALVAQHQTSESAPGSSGRLIFPEHALDGPSLVAAADLMVSAGGTMNREAVALGTPVHTVFAGRMGAVDEQLLATGRLRRLESADDVELVRFTRGDRPQLRDPDTLLDLLLTGLPTRA